MMIGRERERERGKVYEEGKEEGNIKIGKKGRGGSVNGETGKERIGRE